MQHVCLPVRRRVPALLSCLATVCLAAPSPAAAGDVAVELEPGVAVPLSAPQTDHYGVGGAESLKAMFGVTRFLDVGPDVSFMMLPANKQGAESGVAWSFGGGLRLKRPHDADNFGGVSPWLDADLLYVRTGQLGRPAVDAAVGLAVPIGEARHFWVGPFVRYLQVVQTPDRVGFDNHDARVLTVGLSFEAGRGRKLAVVEAPPVAPVAPTVVTRDVVSCPDRDGDSLPDGIDRCPDLKGPIENVGCPVYDKVVIAPDRIELKDKLYFDWDEATLEPASFEELDQVAQVLKDNPNIKVQVEGHTDSSGADAHNQSLSEGRAHAVVDYLVKQGVASDRLVAKGFSSSRPTDTNSTPGGRENNRRVEFIVTFPIVTSGSAK